ncbi:MAG TPA: DUF4476 domain-containing protein, partial [Deltaproteobacteria bacterium]|nr:DUF4476 domain-containing protein [Deltaproteobacteria bacterium]
ATATGAEALLILDTCYSGRDRSGASLQPGDRFAVPGWISDAPDRVAEWSAAGPDEWAGSLDEARHGAFTYLALGALRGWADGQLGDPPDGRISLEEAHRFVQDGLRTLGITDQHPVLLGDRGWVVSEATERPPRLTAPRPAPAPLPQVSALQPTQTQPTQTQPTQTQPTQTQPTQTQPTQTQPVASGPQADEDWLNEGWSEPMDELMAFIDTSELNRLLERAQQLPLPSPDELGMLDALLEQDRGPASAGRTPRGSDPRLPPPGRRLDPVALQQLLLTLQEATYVHAKLELLQRLEIPLTSAQVGQLLDVLHHPSQRVQAVRILAPWVEDPSSVDAILAHCSWDDERRQIREVMEAYAQR